MTGYHDYLIVLSPSLSVAKSVESAKNLCFKKIGEYNSHYAKAHITIQRWPRKRQEWIEPMIPKLERELKSLPPVLLDIDGFDFFDHQTNPTIYAKLNSTPLTQVWFKHLRRFFSKPDFEPHITIARSIPNEDFFKIWPYFKHSVWNEPFKVDKLTILRREMIGHDKSYKLFKEIAFNSRLNFYDFANSRLKAPILSLNKVNSQQINLF
ncbi:2'-5' RNA ligase family protein [Mucilaginibacter sp.]|uniref:2'-5' RNA ligase family protein n=1 Tax=Mucilaginibacter sp. TaxID=1882438 RepID=UPI003D0B9788